MPKVNLSAIKEHVSTQYGDLTGVIQLDGHQNIMALYDLCKDHNIETTDKFIVGFKLGESSINGVGRTNSVSCSILYVSKAEYGENFDEIQAKLKPTGTLKLKKEDVYVSYSDLSKYIKRFEFLALTEMARFANVIEIDED